MQNQYVVEVPELKGTSLGMYDNRHSSEPTVVAEKVMDITSLTNSPQERTYLLYGKTVRGWLVQIKQCYPGKDYGVQIHFYYDEDDTLWIETFPGWAHLLGMTPPRLLMLIHLYAPNHQ